jgi:transcriptional adapter 3
MGDKGAVKRFSSSGQRNRNGSGKTANNFRARSSSPENLPESVPIIPHIKLADNEHTLPTYTAALNRSSQDSVPSEDLDAIQLELEMLLSTVALRHRVLRQELDTIDSSDDRKSSKSRQIDKPPISPGKRRRTDDQQQQQQQNLQQQLEKRAKLRDTAGKLAHNIKMGKLKSSTASSPAPSQHTDDSSDAHSFTQSSARSKNQNAKLLQRNAVPDKFWMSIEPYCMPITQEDLRLLDDLIQEFSGPSLPPIPELGAHYSVQWGLEDVKEEQDNSSPQIKGKRGQNAGQQQNGEVMRILRNSKKVMGDGVTGPLTQRLVSALMEENLINDAATTTTTSTENSNSSLENIPNNSLMQTRSTVGVLKNGISIERRVKKELVEQGILDEEDLDPAQPDDEILEEVKRVRNEFHAIAKFNTSELLKLQSIAKDEMRRLEIKRKLDDVDQEILETHEKLLLAKQKGRKMSKQERDDIVRLTDKQKKLTTEMENIKIPGYTADLT